MARPHSAVGCYAVCDCGISKSHSLTFLFINIFYSLVILLFLQIDAGSVNIELQVLQFDNPTGTSYYGSDFKGPRKCCDLPGNTSCTNAPTHDYCDTFITICIGR